MNLISSLYVALLPVLISATGPSTINLPKNGTHIAPGAEFAFDYHALGDYCQSSFNFTVWLFTSKPKSAHPAQTWATGHYFGRYGIENYPGNPDPENPPPGSLIMPDFSQSPGGFGAGKVATNKPVWLVVLEETATCQAALGNRLAMNWVELIYNPTTAPTYTM